MAIDSVLIHDLILPGAGGRRIFRILLPETCVHACEECPLRSQRLLPLSAHEPGRLARLFLAAFRRGWCDGLFVMCGLPKDPVAATEKTLELIQTLRVTLGYRGYLHVKALQGAQPGQIERLTRLVDRVSYQMEPACLEKRDGVAPRPPEGMPRQAAENAVLLRKGVPKRHRPTQPFPSPSLRPAQRLRLVSPPRFVRRFVQPGLFEIPPRHSSTESYGKSSLAVQW